MYQGFVNRLLEHNNTCYAMKREVSCFSVLIMVTSKLGRLVDDLPRYGTETETKQR